MFSARIYYRRTSYGEYKSTDTYQAQAAYINTAMTLRSGCPGGLKGQTALSGDAHPYLEALFDLYFDVVLQK